MPKRVQWPRYILSIVQSIDSPEESAMAEVDLDDSLLIAYYTLYSLYTVHYTLTL
jgi:hypothetical protein